jgi:hypothetical protein
MVVKLIKGTWAFFVAWAESIQEYRQSKDYKNYY